jgi:nucleoside 2-deoxyribosyltransferase
MFPRGVIKLYLAGPQVFLPNAAEVAETQRELCCAYGFVPLHPMDNNINISKKTFATATRIYRGDVKQIRQCHIVVADCNPFRGPMIDDGTAYELGYGNALDKPSYGYVAADRTYNFRIAVHGLAHYSEQYKDYVDRQGFLLTDDFGTRINLMMECGMCEYGGRLVIGSFEDCLKEIRNDIRSGRLSIQL